MVAEAMQLAWRGTTYLQSDDNLPNFPIPGRVVTEHRCRRVRGRSAQYRDSRSCTTTGRATGPMAESARMGGMGRRAGAAFPETRRRAKQGRREGTQETHDDQSLQRPAAMARRRAQLAGCRCGSGVRVAPGDSSRRCPAGTARTQQQTERIVQRQRSLGTAVHRSISGTSPTVSDARSVRLSPPTPQRPSDAQKSQNRTQTVPNDVVHGFPDEPIAQPEDTDRRVLRGGLDAERSRKAAGVPSAVLTPDRTLRQAEDATPSDRRRSDRTGREAPAVRVARQPDRRARAAPEREPSSGMRMSARAQAAQPVVRVEHTVGGGWGRQAEGWSALGA